jgi:hypothetical protein
MSNELPPRDTEAADFAPYARLADDLIDPATQDQLGDVARLALGLSAWSAHV